ncbi:glutamine ABC transporter substrate-binding protein GlnH [Sporosarcina sp. P16a]|uniref:glutamine ABC transporter substrate-binding protein GlnH n=1 Tax=unclassified Sporosarcina TaxID=2647733 RepID=UPI000C16BA98|nr:MULTISPECIES: glutamine ABC transporter substrate-binding protein GlnH [unclassified Sporosarcina]PIC67995.1 glutamine ABC transporter substrate-binding protein GlnH [Sporosarcina sp. P16a]PIC94304.1 glutamine ABC transporter substrate-binding protein GlnH [Sporosarcina sp. P25]
MQKRTFINVIAGTALASSLLLFGCSSDKSPSETSAKETSEKKVLIVGTDTSYVPFEFLDQESGEYVGFDIDLLKAVSEEAGFEYELKPMDFTGIIPALQTKNLDLAIAGITIKPEREAIIDFSAPYYDAGTAILVREDETEIQSVADLKGKVVATKQGTSSYDYASEIEGLKDLVPFPNIDQAYMELEKGSADAVIFDLPNIQYYIKTNGQGKVKTIGDLLEGQSFGIAMPKGSELKEDVDNALTTLMENGKYEELYKEWFGEAPPKK